jgi:WhiB family redox-sensing transcriptional regulator
MQQPDYGEYAADDDWRRRADCLGMNPDLFFPLKGETGRTAKIICSHCEVSYICLDYAISTHQEYGIWGGLDEKEIRAEISYRARQRRTGEQIIKRTVIVDRFKD